MLLDFRNDSHRNSGGSRIACFESFAAIPRMGSFELGPWLQKWRRSSFVAIAALADTGTRQTSTLVPMLKPVEP